MRLHPARGSQRETSRSTRAPQSSNAWRTFAAGLLWLTAAFFISSAARAEAQLYVFQPYRQAEGLSNLSILSLAFDSQGFLWIATENGVYRFLGTDFQRFGPEQGIQEQQSNQVYAAPDGTLWVATEHNLYFWNGTRFLPTSSTPLRLIDAHGIVSDAPGHLIVIDHARLSRFAYRPDGTLISQEPFFPASAIAADPHLASIGTMTLAADRTLWFSCGPDLCAWQQNHLRHWGAAEGISGERIVSILAAPNGSIWTVTQHHVLELAPNTPRFVDRSPPALDSNRMFDTLPIVADPEGHILISAADGIARWDGSRWQSVGPANGLHSTHITALVFDASGELWLGSTGHGLNHWVGYNNWEAWTEAQGLPSANIWSVGLFDHDHAYIGTEKGPATIDLHTGTVQPFFPPGVWTYGHVKGMAQDHLGNLWIGSQAGDVLRLDPVSHRITHIGKLDTYIFDVVIDNSGDVLLCTAEGVFRVQTTPSPPTVTSLPAPAALNPSGAWVYIAHPGHDGSSDWFLARDGLLKLTHGQWSKPAITGLGAHPRPFRYFSAAPSDDSFWVAGFQDDLWHLVPEGDHLHATRLPLPPEYHALGLLGVLADRRGWIWVGTDDGLLLWNTQSWRHITQDNGLIWNDINGGRLAESPDGSIWIGTSGGLSRAAHPERLFHLQPLSLSLLAITQGKVPLPLTGPARLPFAGGDLSFRFAVASPVNRNDLTFHYRLSGVQDSWIETKDSTAHFASLRGGVYTFQVFARDAATGDTSAPLSYTFTILPPWWQTAWFLVLAAFLALVLLALLYRLRVRQLVRQRVKLESLILERTAALEASQHELQHLATHDGLTGLLNRTAILAHLDALLARCRTENFSFTIVLIDLDHFKRINDTLGHLCGDEALRHFANALCHSIRAEDFAGRYGGEEFLVLLSGLCPNAAATRLAELHASLCGLKFHREGHDVIVECSMGATCILPNTADIERHQALAEADRALYAAKQSGRNRFVFQPPTA